MILHLVLKNKIIPWNIDFVLLEKRSESFVRCIVPMLYEPKVEVSFCFENEALTSSSNILGT